jgi:exopolyphosphatase/guanosine-5'-triphosphate,3'-diphosphate pyrophosphatase
MSEEAKRVAVVDLGTNTFNLLIAEVVEESDWKEVFRSSIPVKLAQGGIGRRTISRDRYFRGIDAMHIHRQSIANYQCETVLAYATSAVREADNGADFVEDIFQSTGIRVTIIDGQVEAELIHLGVIQSLPQQDTPVLVMDIGGGSTEFIASKNGKVIWKESFPLGVSRIAEIIDLPDPLGKAGKKELYAMLDAALEPMRSALKAVEVTALVGASGSFTTFAQILEYQQGIYPNEKHPNAAQFDPKKFAQLCKTLQSTPYTNRLSIKGMHPLRADTLQLSSVLVEYVLEKFNIHELYRSKFALKEGAVYRFLK